MASIRGINSLFPCPVCLVPGDQLSSVTQNFELRTSQAMQELYNSVKDKSAKERNEALKAKGLRNVEVSSAHPNCVPLADSPS